MAEFLTPSDLQVFADISEVRAGEMIDDATALAVALAPCIALPSFTNKQAVKAILRGAILRWNEAGTGALQSETAGAFSRTLDTRQERRGMFWPSEIQQLQSLCSSSTAYSVSLAGPDPDPSDGIVIA